MAEALADRIRTAITDLKLMRAGDRVAVAVSGGADSVALLSLLLELRNELGIVLSVAHFNHKLRGKASDADEKFTKSLAARHGLTFHVQGADVAGRAKLERANLEDTARRARYEFFDSLVRDGHASGVAVAHTADDQAETVLGHILRGTGLAGLAGVHPVAGHIVRPLLGLRRAELRAYLRAKKQGWREDATNQDTGRMRARIRRKLIPLLEKQFQPETVRHLLTLAELAREDEAFLNALTEEHFTRLAAKNSDGVRIRVDRLLNQSQEKDFTTVSTKDPAGHAALTNALRTRLVRRIVQEVKPAAGQLNAEHVKAVLELAGRGQNGKMLELPGGLEVRREHDSLLFCARYGNEKTKPESRSPVQFEYQLELSKLPTAIQVPELGCVFRFRVIDWPAKRGQTTYRDSVLDRDTLRSPVVLRNWRPGDKLRPLGHQRAHKLKRLLNKGHVSRWERDGWPVLTSGGCLAWARGLPVAAEFAPSEKTRSGMAIAEENIL